MSAENVEIVRRLAEDFKHRRHERPFEVYAEDIVWDASGFEGMISEIADIYHGHEGVRRFWRLWLEAWSDIEFEVEDIVDAGDHVVMLIRNQRMWGRHSGLEVGIEPYAHVYTFRDGLVVRWRAYRDQESALAAVGIER